MMLATVVLLALLSLVAHEAGHYAAGRALGYRCRFGINWIGPHVKIGIGLRPGDIIGWRARVISLSGPAVNLVLLIVALALRDFWFIAIQLAVLLLASLLDYKHAVWVRHA